MKYGILAASLVCGLGMHVAFAQESPSDQSTGQKEGQPTQQQGQPAQKEGQPTQEANQGQANAEQANTVEKASVFFDTASAELRPDADAKLKPLADWAACNPKGALILEGFADPRGTQEFNMELAAKRAATVRQKLVAMGVRSDRIVISVYGENGPKEPDNQDARRVSIRPAETPVEASEISAMR